MEFWKTIMYIIWSLVGAFSLVMGIFSIWWYRKYFSWTKDVFGKENKE